MTLNAANNYVYRSKCNQKPFSFRWEIEQFPECLPSIETQYYSPDFEVANGAELYVDLERDRVNDGDWLSVTLWMGGQEVKKTTLDFSVALLRSPPKEDHRKSVKLYQFLTPQSDKSFYEFPKFIRFSDLVNPEEGFLKDGHQLTILVEGNVFYGRDVDDYQNKLTPKQSSADLEANLRIQTFEKFKILFDEGLHSDFVVKARDTKGVEKELKVHKGVLSIGSKLFAAMLSNPELKESREGVMVVEDIRFEVMEALVRFLYGGELSSDYAMEIELGLLVAVDKYAIDGLKNLVERRLTASLSVEGVCELFANADLLKASFLKARCAEFIREQRKLVVKTDGWKNLSPRLTTFLFSGEEIDDEDNDSDWSLAEDVVGRAEMRESSATSSSSTPDRPPRLNAGSLFYGYEQRKHIEEYERKKKERAEKPSSSSSVTASGGRKRRRRQ